MANTDLLSTLSTRSKRALYRAKGKFGNPHEYIPKGKLLERLAQKHGMTIEQVYADLLELRREYLQNTGQLD